MCNEWAIDTPCPAGSRDFCRSLHILDSRGNSVLASKFFLSSFLFSFTLSQHLTPLSLSLSLFLSLRKDFESARLTLSLPRNIRTVASSVARSSFLGTEKLCFVSCFTIPTGTSLHNWCNLPLKETLNWRRDESRRARTIFSLCSMALKLVVFFLAARCRFYSALAASFTVKSVTEPITIDVA